MAFDPAGLVNTSLAATFAAAQLARVLFALIAPDTPEAARRRFVKTMRRVFERVARSSHVDTAEFADESVALDQLRRSLPLDRGEDVAAVNAGLVLLGAGRELIRLRDQGRSGSADTGIADDIASFLTSNERRPLDRALHNARDDSVKRLADVRNDGLGVAASRTAAREMFAFAAVGNELERCRALLFEHEAKGAPIHVA